MTTVFMNKAALKDFHSDYYSILFTSPLKKSSYMLGRFLSGLSLAVLVQFGVYFAFLVAPLLINQETIKSGSLFPMAYVNSFLLFLLPNTLIIGAIIYGLAQIFRSTTASFIGAVGLLIGYIMAGNLITQLDKESLALFLDPLGIHSFSIITKYWTVAEKNSEVPSLTGPLVYNRLLWVCISLIIFGITYIKSTMGAIVKKKRNKNHQESEEVRVLYKPMNALPLSHKFHNTLSHLMSCLLIVKNEIRTTVKSPAFIILALFAMMNATMAISNADVYYGVGNHPVTYLVLDAISNSFYMFLVIIIGYYSGVMLWRERNAKMNEIIDATPYPFWVPTLGKFLSMVAIVAILLVVAGSIGILTQTIKGYTHFEFDLYFKQLLLIDLSKMTVFIAVCFFIQIIVNNMNLGFFLFVLFLLVNSFGWSALNIESNLLKIGNVPGLIYSDMSTYLPYVKGLVAYNFHWLLFSVIILINASLFSHRGKENRFRTRARMALSRLKGKAIVPMATLLTVWMISAGFLFYNAEIVNDYSTKNASDALSSGYEKKYDRFKDFPQPRIVSLDYHIDMFPEKRSIEADVEVMLLNKQEAPIDTILFSMPSLFTSEIDIPGAAVAIEDKEQKFYAYKLAQALSPGDSLQLFIRSAYIPRGIENEVTTKRITQNGIFVDHQELIPTIGYAHGRELDNNVDRHNFDLDSLQGMPGLKKHCSSHCQNSYISTDADLIDFSCTISTSSDQIAIAPGSLIKEWEQEGRKFFRYELDRKIQNFYSFLSAKYEVKREKWNDVDLEVYYHPGHDYNVDRMMKSMRASLTYYSQAFTPYPFKQARIIEFPRFMSFAQAFPGTMPYSESMGFIADMEEDATIDKSFFFVAHEMAHQWWGHQVAPAAVQGATMLSESFAQYSALMVMEQEYGMDKMNEFLSYEMDMYLRSRGSETNEELPLMKVEGQEYIHYRKGSVIMYALRQYLGEDSLNLALRRFAEKYAFSEAPYPNSLNFMSELDRVTPDSLKYLVEDMIEKVVIYNNRAVDAYGTILEDGSHQVSIEVDVVKYNVEDQGVEQEATVDDYIYIGAYDDKGALSYYQKHKLKGGKSTITIMTEELPAKVGIDPLYLLIDRIPDDNMVEVKMAN